MAEPGIEPRTFWLEGSDGISEPTIQMNTTFTEPHSYSAG